MKIALVWPKGFDTEYVMPLSMGYLKSNLDLKKHEVRIFDNALDDLPADSEEFKELLKEFDPDIVGVSCWSPTYQEACDVLQLAKNLHTNTKEIILTKKAAEKFKEFMKQEGYSNAVLHIECALPHTQKSTLQFSFTQKPYSGEHCFTAHGIKICISNYNLLHIQGTTIDYDGTQIQITPLHKQVLTVMGGAHASSYPDPIMKNPEVDFVFRGEAELSFPLFLEQLEKKSPDFTKVLGLVYRTSPTEIVKNEMERERKLDAINIPDYDAMNLHAYIQQGYRFNTPYKMNAPVWITRGCPYRCSFCSAPLQNGRLIRKHSIKYMVDWVKYLYHEKGIRMINIIDDNFTFHMDYAKEFCNEMIKLNLPDLRFGTPNGIRLQRTDTELLSLMKLAGWENLIVAPESGSKETLKRMRKDLDPDIIPDKVQEIKDAGLKVHGFFIIGYPGETPEDLQKTVDLIRKCKFNFFFLNNFQPLPGTPIYDELVAEGKIEEGLLPKNYSGGERVYVPEALEDFNFPRFVLKEYGVLALTDPLNIPYMFKLVSPGLIAKKVYSNMKNMILPNGKSKDASIAPKVMLSQEG